jgi:hypothetical protein
MRIPLQLVIAFIVALPASAAGAAEAGGPPDPADYSPARVLSRPAIGFPESEEREAVVYVRFLVSRDGVPMQAEVDEMRGFHNEVFRKAALAYVNKMRFEPARLHGEPVEVGPLTQPINFHFGGKVDPESESVSEDFMRELDKVGYLLRKRDYAGAHFHAEWMLREKVQRNFEFAVLQAQLAQTYATLGNAEEALEAANRATIRSGTESADFRLGQPIPKNDPSSYLLPRKLVLFLLDLRMQLEAQQGNVVRALKTYNELAGLKKIAPKDNAALLAGKLAELLESGRPLATAGKVTKEYWSHEQYHPSFALLGVVGKVNLFHVHCQGTFREYPYVEGSTWSIPEGGQGCTVEVYGEPGTSFNFVELPAGAKLTAAPQPQPG